jgi:hypothetical protein
MERVDLDINKDIKHLDIAWKEKNPVKSNDKNPSIETK